MVALLAQAGAEVWKDNRSEGASYYFLDPDGHKLELWGIWRSGWPPVANAPTRGWSFLIDGLVQLTAGFQRADPQR
ncbi:hypothetical protein ECZU28_51170 [Escherichia coli]|nr:hypothetical protein ECZU28_51170 [Escherichia coli]